MSAHRDRDGWLSRQIHSSQQQLAALPAALRDNLRFTGNSHRDYPGPPRVPRVLHRDR